MGGLERKMCKGASSGVAPPPKHQQRADEDTRTHTRGPHSPCDDGAFYSPASDGDEAGAGDGAGDDDSDDDDADDEDDQS